MLFLTIFLRLSFMHIAGGDGTNEMRLTFLTECEHDNHGPSVARTSPDREEPLFLLRVCDIRGDIQAFLAEKCFDLFESEPMLLAFLPVAVVPIKPENLYMSHTLLRVGICLYKCQGSMAKTGRSIYHAL
jgi:hypothetical protein